MYDDIQVMKYADKNPRFRVISCLNILIFLQINPSFFESVDKRLQFHDIPKRLVHLEKCCTTQNFDVERCRQIISVWFDVLYRNMIT